MRDRIASTVAVVFLVLGTLAGTAQAAGPAGVSPPTQRVLVQPFAGDSGDLASGYHVVRSSPGYCWTTSSASPRSNAYRCFYGKNAIIDPCFSTPGHVDVGWVACPTGNPFGGAVARIQLTQKLPTAAKGGSSGASFPYAVRLVSGRTCSVSTGANSVLKGREALYYCAGGGFLGARIFQTGTHWTAWFLPSQQGSWRRTSVREAAF